MPKKPKIVIIIGPTASGKTSLAVFLAKALSGEVISADSRQVYRHLDLGTAKITEPEKEGIPHHLIDVALPSEVYSITDWISATKGAIEEIVTRGHVPIIAGGTMQYIDALLGKQTPARVPPNPELRERLEKLDTETLFAMLRDVDPRRAETIDRHNPRRLVRALEIVDTLGAVPETPSHESPYDAYLIGLTLPKDELRERIVTRLHERIDSGLVEEAKRALEKYATPERLHEIGLEYRVVMEYLRGEMTESAMRTKLEEKNWQYAKRQMTWLKNMNDVHWYAPTQKDAILSAVQIFLQT